MYAGLRFCLFIFLLVFCCASRGQIVTEVSHYTTSQGLLDNRINHIIKDKQGFMWFASWAGITRFDGYHFVNFKSFPGDRSPLKSSRIDQIVEDANERYLWLKAYDLHLYRFDKRTQQFESLTDLLGLPPSDGFQVTKILLARDNELWLITENQGIVLISEPDKARLKYTLFSANQKSPYRIPANRSLFFHAVRNRNIWMQTTAGLVLLKYQSKGVYHVWSPDWLIDTEVSAVAEGLGRNWFLCSDGRLLWTGRDFNKPVLIALHGIKPGKIFASKRSRVLYCTTSTGELFSIAEDGSIKRCFKLKEQSPLFYIYEDRGGVLWIESDKFGLIRFDPQSEKNEYVVSPGNYSFNPSSRNLSFFEDKNATIWTVINGQLYFFNKELRRMETLSSRLEARSPNMSLNARRVFYDISGVLWISNGFDGLDKVVFREQDFQQVLLKSESVQREDNEVRGLLVDKQNRTWVATKARVVYLFDKGSRLENPFDKPPVNTSGIYVIKQDRRGRIWMGTKADGLIRADPVGNSQNRFKISQYRQSGARDEKSISSNSIYSVFEDSKGRLWAGSYDNGIFLIEERAGKTVFKTLFNSFKNYPKNEFRKVRHLAEDAYGRIWVGTTDGLLIFDPNKGSPDSYYFNQYKKIPGEIHSLGGNDIQFLFKDSKNRMWVLTTAGGLNLSLNEKDPKSITFQNYSMKNGLPSDFLLSCNEDAEGNLWISTQNGLSRFSFDKGTFQNFSSTDGLPEVNFSEASCARSAQGKLIFGTTGGYLSFDPKHIRIEKVDAGISLTNIQVNREDVGSGSPLVYSLNDQPKLLLKHDENVISIDFAVLDFHSLNKQNYYTRLLGFDNVWRSTEGQRSITYTRLPPGNYVFEVKCANDELYQKVPFTSLAIVIQPPFWQTWWAYAIYLLCGSGIFLGVRRVLITMLRLRQKVEVEKQLAELKLNFFTQVSHELRTPLTLIINPSEEVLESENLSAKGKDRVSVVIRNARRMLRLVNNVLDLRKVQSGRASLNLQTVEVISFVRSLLDYFQQSISQKQLKMEVSSALGELFVQADKDKLEIIVYNLLANAIKFSSDRGAIKISVTEEASKTFTIEVADEGIGVADDELDDIFKLYYEGKSSANREVKGTGIGLALSKELVGLHNGEVVAGHNLPKGLKVTVRLPKGEVDLKNVSKEIEQPSEKGLNQDVNPVSEETTSFVSDGKTETPIVLIVEDNDELRSFLESKFEGLYKIETAANGRIGLEKANNIIPDLILSDVMMPEMDGIEMLNQLKNNIETSHIPVILLTAKSTVESQIEGLKYGADFYITKPFDMGLLQTAMFSIIHQRKKLFQNLQGSLQPNAITTEAASPAADQIVITEYDRAFLDKLLKIVEEKAVDANFNIDDVAGSMSMSRSSFYRKFSSLTNQAPVEFLRDVRLQKAVTIFDAGEDNISSAAYASGFNNPKYFSFCFKAKYNQTPSEYVRSVKAGKRKG